jgi:BioD-like phosphotransacetylase family protein
VPKAKHLLIGSTRAWSGKSATVMGLAFHLQRRGLAIGYGKPLGTFATKSVPESAQKQEGDVEFVTQTLNLAPESLRPTLVSLDKNKIRQRLLEQDQTDYLAALTQYHDNPAGDLVLVEAPGNPEEGAMFGLSMQQIADCLEAPILLVARYDDLLVVDRLLLAKKRLGDRLIGAVINDIPEDQEQEGLEVLRTYLEHKGIPVLAMMPENRILRSVSVSELISQLEAEVLYSPSNIDLGDLMVEDLKIGAMDVSSAQLFFRNSYNKAVVTGSNRFDIQLAALETSTHCLILTGPPILDEHVAARASELYVPILSVTKDTLSVVEIIERCLGQVRLHEGVKVKCIQDMMADQFDFDRLLADLDIKQPVASV